MAERAAKQLELNKSELPNSITEVIATLSRAGFDAYIVGGGVRDTLLGLKPKDFDAVTDAKPHEIKDVFGKRCRIIGRRFQLAHVYSGRELIEVATFRGPPNNNANTNQDGMIIRDNVWGDIKQDFARRDFSINALYYQPLKGIVHDFCGALDDIRNRTIRLLGHAPVRIEEDPVRLLRALRFKAKLGFDFDDDLEAQFHQGNWALLEQISPHRLYDETQKMFTGGYLEPLLPLLFESGAIDSLIVYPPSEPSSLVQQVATNTDKRINAGKSINPAFFYAALLWENYLHQLEKAKKRNMPFADAQVQAAGKVIERQRIKTAIPKFAEQFIRDIWILQPKLSAPRSKQIEPLSEHPRFRAAFDFLLLREQCGDAEHPLSESTNQMGEWWETYQALSYQQKQQAIEDFDENIRRGAYKQSKNERRARNRQQPNQGANIALAPESASHKPPVVKDASNIPARRHRADQAVISTELPFESIESTATAQKPRPAKNAKANKRSPKAKHDNNERLLLQQLSLANTLTVDVANNPPAPLFVIEHENVVPPLQKQLSAEPIKPSSTDPVKSVAKKSTPVSPPKVTSGTQVHDIQVKAQAKEQQVDNKRPVATPPKQPMATQAMYSVAQTPKLVSINNEPIPAKRRRRQPSVSVAIATDASMNSDAPDKKTVPKTVQQKPVQQGATEVNAKVNAEANAQKTASPKATTAKPAKASQRTRASKTAQAAVDKEATTTNIVAPKTAANIAISNGPVPAKRRRRQPSSDMTVIERQGS